MKLIAGLGNPGTEYEGTRHNTGFAVIDRIAAELSIPLDRRKFRGLYGIGESGGEKVLLLKPQTYMNLSGECVRPLMDYYRISAGDLLVIYDDMDLPVGTIRLREKGSSGGHNGMKSIIQCLGTQEFRRIRVGIGNRGIIPGPDYVLGKIRPQEKELYEKALDYAAEAAEASLGEPFEKVMSRCNGSVHEES